MVHISNSSKIEGILLTQIDLHVKRIEIAFNSWLRHPGSVREDECSVAFLISNSCIQADNTLICFSIQYLVATESVTGT